MRSYVALTLFAALTSIAAAQDFPLHVIRIEGARRYSPEALGALTGLRVGEPVNPERFNEGARLLGESGFVAGAQFRYEPAEVDGKAGYAVIFQVKEIDTVSKPVLDIPGHAEADLWKALQQRDPLLTPEMPRTPAAEARYLAALADVVAATGAPRPELQMEIEGDMTTGRTTEVIVPKNLPVVSAVHVAGTKALAAGKAVAALESVAIGQPVTERRFLRYAVENVTPLFEELGHLKTAYPRIEMAPSGGGVAVTLHCEEGIEYQLGEMKLSGEGVDAAALAKAGDFPVDKTANWKKILEGLDRVRNEFRKDGYLNARLSAKRTLDDAAARVDVAVEIRRGTQFVMGELLLPGLDAKEEAKARKRWKLAAGEPLNALYVDEFLKEAFSALEGVTGVSQQFARRGDSNVMDVSVTFRK